MIDFCVVILFMALVINIPTTIAYLKGLKFQIEDFECPQEVADVKRNIRLTKIIQVINLIILLILFIIFNILKG